MWLSLKKELKGSPFEISTLTFTRAIPDVISELVRVTLLDSGTYVRSKSSASHLLSLDRSAAASSFRSSKTASRKLWTVASGDVGLNSFTSWEESKMAEPEPIRVKVRAIAMSIRFGEVRMRTSLNS